MPDHSSSPSPEAATPWLAAMTVRLSPWAACSAEKNAARIEQPDVMGYAMRGTSLEQMAEVLHHSWMRPRTS
ncbi:hypothetical protein VP06_28070 [Methylobacterium aquaticum]|jgi:hypothetical protein|uniref:Uncharacterized protein n=1 Tax=Methylobacterium aquaticum TaxID=270351 RepID=A0A0J6S3L3_9HYPH|nr:hypothetical protein VP06_28070 [Methylobacterium aquaticum]